MKLWKTKPSLLVAEFGELFAVESGDGDAVQQVFAAGRLVEAAESVHQGGFARAAGTHDGDEIAAQMSKVTPRTAFTSTSPV